MITRWLYSAADGLIFTLVVYFYTFAFIWNNVNWQLIAGVVVSRSHFSDLEWSYYDYEKLNSIWGEILANVQILILKDGVLSFQRTVQLSFCGFSWTLCVFFFFCVVEIFQLFLSTGTWEGRGSGTDTKGNIIPQRICATSFHEWSIEKHNIGDKIIFHPS